MATRYVPYAHRKQSARRAAADMRAAVDDAAALDIASLTGPPRVVDATPKPVTDVITNGVKGHIGLLAMGGGPAPVYFYDLGDGLHLWGQSVILSTDMARKLAQHLTAWADLRDTTKEN